MEITASTYNPLQNALLNKLISQLVIQHTSSWLHIHNYHNCICPLPGCSFCTNPLSHIRVFFCFSASLFSSHDMFTFWREIISFLVTENDSEVWFHSQGSCGSLFWDNNCNLHISTFFFFRNTISTLFSKRSIIIFFLNTAQILVRRFQWYSWCKSF